MRGERVVIPKSFRKQTLEDQHTAHQGVQPTLRRARESVYWRNMNSDVKIPMRNMKHFSLATAQKAAVRSRSTEPTLGEIRSRPFPIWKQRIFRDGRLFFGFLWSRPVGQHIARYGIPEKIVSDIGVQYDSDEFEAFAQSYGFSHTCTSPHYPQSNNKAESAVKQAKMIKESGTDYYLALVNVRTRRRRTYLKSSPMIDESTHKDNTSYIKEAHETSRTRKHTVKYRLETAKTAKLLQQRSQETLAATQSGQS